ncbi:hypothetical protein ANRL2_03764 [Anaerolineae bacterium]|nr:hypothetical protein ANRL2_03764 [Anaerolineae bacterium]
MFDTIQQYISVIGGIIGIVSSSVSLMNKTEGTSGKPYNKVLKLIIAISLVGLLTGTAISAYTIANTESIRREYFRDRQVTLLQNNFEANQEFEAYFAENHIKPSMRIIGGSIIVLAIAFLAGSFSKPNPSTVEFTLEIVWLLIGVWLLI